jgi:hypothetical protein
MNFDLVQQLCGHFNAAEFLGIKISLNCSNVTQFVLGEGGIFQMQDGFWVCSETFEYMHYQNICM